MTIAFVHYTNMMGIMILLVVPLTNMIGINDKFFVCFPVLMGIIDRFGCSLQLNVVYYRHICLFLALIRSEIITFYFLFTLKHFGIVTLSLDICSDKMGTNDSFVCTLR